jgi:hypothetical protein
LEQIEAQLNREDVRHLDRVAFLQQQLQLAEEKGDDKAIERIHLLLSREQDLHDSLVLRLEERKEEILSQLG